MKVSSLDQISVNGVSLPSEKEHKYLIINKPVQVVSTLNDPQGRTTLLDLIPEKYKVYRLFPVGRLDYFSEGLLILTNDGELANALMHPRYQHEKIYEVTVRGKVSEKELQSLKKGFLLEDRITLLPMEIVSYPLKNGETRLLFTLKQGINRQIRRIARQLGWIILKLKRVSEASIKLGKLKPGEYRELTIEEIKRLERTYLRSPEG